LNCHLPARRIFERFGQGLGCRGPTPPGPLSIGSHPKKYVSDRGTDMNYFAGAYFDLCELKPLGGPAIPKLKDPRMSPTFREYSPQWLLSHQKA